MILWTMFICVHSFSVSGKKQQQKNKQKKVKPRTCVWRCIGEKVVVVGGGGGVLGAPQLKKDDKRFLFSGFSVFRI